MLRSWVVLIAFFVWDLRLLSTRYIALKSV